MLGGGIAPLICKFGSRQMIVVRLSALATLLPEKKLWFSWSWRLDGRSRLSGCFGEEIVLLLLPRFEPLVIVLTMVPHIDLKIMQKSMLLK
jgi:hypothetical protein